MPRKSAAEEEELEIEEVTEEENEVEKLTRFLAAVLEYLSDDDVEVIDIDYLLTHTEGLREWWEDYQENNRKRLEQEIRASLTELSLEELKSIHEQIKEKQV